LYAPLRPAIDEAGPNLAAAVDVNARRQAALIAGASPVIAAAVKDGKLKVVAARYDIANGRVTNLA
jgi:carbonic anhydrase